MPGRQEGMVEMTPDQLILMDLMIGAVPERESEIRQLWLDYHPKVIVESTERLSLKADCEKITIDVKIPDVFWLIGFSGWRAIETYGQAIVCSVKRSVRISAILARDDTFREFERDYKERIAAAQAFIATREAPAAPWPPDIPRPSTNRDAMNDDQYKAAFDLTTSALAFVIFHEFRHVMLGRDGNRPKDRREEELASDVYAREFITAKAEAYALRKGFSYVQVLERRAMSFALGALILYEITPVWGRGGNEEYFSITTRLEAIRS
jgi:hypothetical protein